MATPKLDIPPIPFREPISDQQGNLSLAWIGFFRNLYKVLTILQTEIDDIRQGPAL